MNNSLTNMRKDNIQMLSSFFNIIDIELKQTSELQRQILAAFSFGMVYSKGRENSLSASEIHAISILYLQDFFEYSLTQATQQSELLIQAASDSKVHDVLHAVIHRGVDGYFQWKISDESSLRNNIEEIFNAIGITA